MSSSRKSDDMRELRDLATDVAPPPELEERVVAELRQRGLVHPPGGHARSEWRPRFAMAAGLLVAALGGWLARGVVEAAPPPASIASDPVASDPVASAPAERSKEYLLLLSEPEGLDTEKQTAELVGEYRDWAGELAADDLLVSARRLDRGSRDLTTGAVEPFEVSETPWATEATGFFLVRAGSLDEAIALAAGCPHLGYGGKISVSEVAQSAG